MPVNYAKVVSTGTFGPTTWANVFYFLVLSWDPAHLQDVAGVLADAMHDFYNVVMHGQLSDQMSLQLTRVSFRDATDSVYSFNVADVVVGANSGGAQDAQVSFLINWQAGDPRRGGKPRNYIVGVPDSQVADSARLIPGALSAVNPRIETWLAANSTRTHGTAEGCRLVEMSFRNDKTWLDTPVPRNIVGGLLDNVVATQRRRIDRLR